MVQCRAWGQCSCCQKNYKLKLVWRVNIKAIDYTCLCYMSFSYLFYSNCMLHVTLVDFLFFFCLLIFCIVHIWWACVWSRLCIVLLLIYLSACRFIFVVSKCCYLFVLHIFIIINIYMFLSLNYVFMLFHCVFCLCLLLSQIPCFGNHNLFSHNFISLFTV